MAKDYLDDLPTPPALPKKLPVAKPITTPSPDRVTSLRPNVGDRVTDRELAESTRGPISSEADVSKQIGSEAGRRFNAVQKFEKDTLSKPYQLRGSRSMSGKR